MRRYGQIIGWTAGVALLGAAGLSVAADRSPAMPPMAAAAATETQGSRADREVGATVLDQQDVQGILGRQVLSSTGQDMGRVIDVVVDRTGQVRAAVIDFGGFLGVGNRRVAVDWSALHFAPTGSKYDRITLEMTREQVNTAPEYKTDRPLVVLGAADSLPY
jgi:PRC-barrel domain protein